MNRRPLGLRALRWLLLLVIVGAAAATMLAWRWVDQPLSLSQPTVQLSIESGSTPREVARDWAAAGVNAPDWMLYAWIRWSGQARQIRAGTYELSFGATPRQWLDMMVQGRELLESIRLPEGWTLRQWRLELAKAPHLQPASEGMSEAALMKAIGAPDVKGEGRFFPDTYTYSRGVTDLTILRRAFAAMSEHLADAWAQRDPALPLASPDDALILASIVEKETGRAEERGLVAGVFANRLRIGMPLQTDPTIIYGLGESFDGNLRKRDLLADGPYNTYRRTGLPPTPITMPGLASLRAAVNPTPTTALYFVARGDGSSVFSDNLADHNRAVNEFQRRRK